MASRYIAAEIPLGLDGFFGDDNPATIPISGLINTNAINFRTNAIRKEPGAVKLNSTAISGSPAIYGGHLFDHDGITPRHIIHTSDGRLLKDDGSGNFTTTLASGLTASVNPVFVEGGKEGAALNRKLFIFTGSNDVKVLSGNDVTVTNLATPPVDWVGNPPSSGFIFDGRLVGFGNKNQTHRLYFSTDIDHENFVGTGSFNIAVFPGEGLGISAAVPVPGGIIIFKKPKGIYFVDASDPSYMNWRVFKISDSSGPLSQSNLTTFDENILFISSDGRLKSLSVGEGIGIFRLNDLFNDTQVGNYIKRNFNTFALDRWRLISYKLANEVWLSAPEAGSTVNNRQLIFDTDLKRIRYRISNRDVIESIWTYQEKLFSGDNAGFCWKMDQAIFDKGGIGYESSFKTKELDFSHIDSRLASRNKNFAFLEIEIVPAASSLLFVDVYIDAIKTQTIQFNTPASSGVLGNFVIGTDRLGSSKSVSSIKQRIAGSGRRLQLEFNDAAGITEFSISRIIAHFNVGDERLP